MKVDIEGLDELLSNMLQLPMEDADENGAVNKAAKVVKEAVAAEAPVGRGTLKANIKAKRAIDGVAVVHTGGAFHGHLVEFGRSGGSKMAVKNGKQQKVTWGPTAPNPFFTRGYEASKNQAQQAMADELKKRLKL